MGRIIKKPYRTDNMHGKLSSLTEERKAGILQMIRAGAYPHVAARAFGVSRQCWWNWMNHKGEEYRAFQEEVEGATAIVRAAVEVEIRKTDPKFWLTRGPGRDKGDPLN